MLWRMTEQSPSLPLLPAPFSEVVTGEAGTPTASTTTGSDDDAFDGMETCHFDLEGLAAGQHPCAAQQAADRFFSGAYSEGERWRHVAALVDQLQPQADDERQFMAAQAVASLAAADERMASALVSASVVPALVQLGRFGHEDVAQAAAFALANLATAGFGAELASCGATELFSTLLRHGGRLTRCVGTYGLACMLADGHVAKGLLPEVGGLLRMVAQIGDECTASIAASALDGLAAGDGEQAGAAANASVARPLVHRC